ncbi:MAG TPA: peptidoglycan-binding protein [Actinobacteria bacterium]|nr:peptidoglycan-binding protein [Actinomycetes bacterium]HEX21621.1 peptidoglycan-binding protein [Actinomycetota bacterium]
MILMLSTNPVFAGSRKNNNLRMNAALGIISSQAAADAGKKRIVSGWLPGWGQKDGLNTINNNSGVINELSPFWYYLNTAGGVSGATGTGDPDVINTARSQNQIILPTISNAFDGSRVVRVIRDPAKRGLLVNNIVSLVIQNNYHGIDIDFENVPAGDRGNFTAFIQELGRGLHAQGKLLSVTVMPKLSEPGNPNAGGSASQDYAAIAAAADRVRIMAYDYHYQSGQPGPIAPAEWVDRLLAFAVTVIPKDKLELGVPTYGYDWAPTGGKTNGRAIIYGKAQQLSAQFGQGIKVDAGSSSPFFNYEAGGVTHHVWFENAQSLSAKLDLVNKYDIAGIAIWSLGKEDPANWQVIKDKLHR